MRYNTLSEYDELRSVPLVPSEETKKLLEALIDAEAKFAMLLDNEKAARGMGNYFAGVQATWARLRVIIATEKRKYGMDIYDF